MRLNTHTYKCMFTQSDTKPGAVFRLSALSWFLEVVSQMRTSVGPGVTAAQTADLIPVCGLNRSHRVCWGGRKWSRGRWQSESALNTFCRELNTKEGGKMSLRVNHTRREDDESIAFNVKSMWLVDVCSGGCCICIGRVAAAVLACNKRVEASETCDLYQQNNDWIRFINVGRTHKVALFDSQLVTISFHLAGRICPFGLTPSRKLKAGLKIYISVPGVKW